METLKAEVRSEGKKAKQLRREGYVVGNLFGKEIEKSIPLQIEKKTLETLLKQHGKGTQLMLDVDGKQYDVLLKDLDYNPMKKEIEEIDFQALVSNEKVHSVAEIVLHNKDKVVDGALEELMTEIAYKALPAALVEKVIVDVGDLHVGDSIKVKDLDMANDKDIDILSDMNAVIVNVVAVHNNIPETEEEAEEAVPEA